VRGTATGLLRRRFGHRGDIVPDAPLEIPVDFSVGVGWVPWPAGLVPCPQPPRLTEPECRRPDLSSTLEQRPFCVTPPCPARQRYTPHLDLERCCGQCTDLPLRWPLWRPRPACRPYIIYTSAPTSGNQALCMPCALCAICGAEDDGARAGTTCTSTTRDACSGRFNWTYTPWNRA